ncbi:hypothetical protein LCGC14_1431850 [marine sediment metagenome]|uniref:Cytochrome-c oxidase n=1 Tax=marine sediment metagenome TaxID=412755 RepID=A0A0F9K9K7_9ZZZZ
MDLVAKNFIRSALIYFAIAAIIGAFIMFTRRVEYHQLKYAHVHVMLLGWLSMMIYGVGYHILPRFNGNPVAFPKLAVIHLWLANIALIGLVSTWGLGYIYKGFGVLNVIGIGMFVLNMLVSIRKPKDDD